MINHLKQMNHRYSNSLRLINIICGIILLSSCVVVDAYAFSWNDLWHTPDQQGAKSLNNDNAQQAATQFENDSWKGIANYRAGNYEQALENFAMEDSAQSDYNRGNTLTHLGQYEAAIAAYDAALEKDPNNEDAIVNREIIKQLLDQQQNQEQGQDPNQDQEQEQENNDQQSPDQSQQSGNDQQDPNQSQQSDNEQQDSNQQPQHDNDPQMPQQNQSPQQPQQQDTHQQDTELPPPTGDDQSQQNDEANDENTSSEQQIAQNSDDQHSDDQPQSAEQLSAQQREQQNSSEQLLRQVPDDPGGLLRQKFLRDHLRLQQQR